jgi:hypothetical protein
MQMFMECSKRGKSFLTNGGRSLRSISSLPFHSFVEGGNGSWFLVLAHLNPVPLVLGNMGDTTTLSGVLGSVRECLSVGCIYSPININLLLDGSDNFVCKLYPITVKKILPGTVIGVERLVTAVSGEFEWPAGDHDVILYSYNSDGRLLPMASIVNAHRSNSKIRIDVPDQGLVIAEIAHALKPDSTR